jgi:hypothetical protein
MILSFRLLDKYIMSKELNAEEDNRKSMTRFFGIKEDVFNSCVHSEKIRIPINMLKDLQTEIEPELKKINPLIKGHVSRIKDRGTNNYRNWAWLYFNTQTEYACKYSQLTVNISPKRLFVGVNIRTPRERLLLRKQLVDEKNRKSVEILLTTLSNRELFFVSDDGDWAVVARKHSIEEVRGKLLSQNLRWVNVYFEKNDPELRRKSITRKILHIFRDLYNVYALATDNDLLIQTASRIKNFVPKIVTETVDSDVDPDKSDEAIINELLATLKENKKNDAHHLYGKNDQYFVRRIAKEYDLHPIKLDIDGKVCTVYSEQDIASNKNQIIQDYPEFTLDLRRNCDISR